VTRLAAVIDDWALALLPGIERDLQQAGVAVVRCYERLPSPAMLRRLSDCRGVAVLGAPDVGALRARLETATATLSAPVVGALPRGEVACPELRGPGVVDLIPAGARGAAERVVLMSSVPIVSAGTRRVAAAPSSRPRDPAAAGPAGPAGPAGAPEPGRRPERVLAIASSTGGVWVLAGLLQGYRARSTTAVLLAQHMDAEFVTFFSDWLATTTPWTTVLVEEAAPLEAGRLYLAAGGRDLVAEPDRVVALPAASRYVPCADRLLRSVAAAHGRRARAVVLSGMGADGADGLAEVARGGGRVACQAPASAVVPSMPESALRRCPGAEQADPGGLAAVLGRE
jgi:two-component system, chemotaxis family, protein-glutamate methylesterase/glutaminase